MDHDDSCGCNGCSPQSNFQKKEDDDDLGVRDSTERRMEDDEPDDKRIPPRLRHTLTLSI